MQKLRNKGMSKEWLDSRESMNEPKKENENEKEWMNKSGERRLSWEVRMKN